jgi:flavin reductase (DIM6/NTAB) family NADH-FMN oxidoreductase RutF
MVGSNFSGVEVDPKTFWSVLGERAIGITIVTTQAADGPRGFLGLSATHVSAQPPTMLVSIDRQTSALNDILATGSFAINFLPASAAHIAGAFSARSGLAGSARFVADEWAPLVTGAPVLKSALGAFDCSVEQIIEHGSTSIILGKVMGARASGAEDPLIYFRGKVRSGIGM